MNKKPNNGRRKTSQQEVLKRYGVRSGLEVKFKDFLAEAGYDFKYESKTLHFIRPAKKGKYTPDFVLTKKDGTEMIIETKGLFTTEDQHKVQFALQQNPGLDFRMVFQNSNGKIYKGSKTTYGDWCDKRGIKWAHKEMPESWANELMSTDKGNKK